MNPSSQYVSGRTVQEQMQQLMDYVEVKSEEVAAAKAEEVLEPAQQAKTDAEAARDRAEAAAAQTVDCVKKTGTDVPQVISGSGGLQVAGDVSVGDDLTVGGSLHADVSNAEIAGMAIEKLGAKTVMSNANGITIGGTGGFEVPDTMTGTDDKKAVNGKRLLAEILRELADYDADVLGMIAEQLDSYSQMVRTTGNQTIDGIKKFTQILSSVTENHKIVTTQANVWFKCFEFEAGNYAINFEIVADRANPFGNGTYHHAHFTIGTSNADIHNIVSHSASELTIGVNRVNNIITVYIRSSVDSHPFHIWVSRVMQQGGYVPEVKEIEGVFNGDIMYSIGGSE